MATDPMGDDWWELEIIEDGDEIRLPVVAEHVDCLIRATLGPGWENFLLEAGVGRVP